MDSLGLYIHIPFCSRKCRYCDFISFEGLDGFFDEYVDAVIAEAELYYDHLKGCTVNTVFIGGGTPSLLSTQQIERLMRGIGGACELKLEEATIEANPETLDEQKLASYAACGINRLSIGLQSHDDDILKLIGRRHTYEMFIRVYELTKKYFKNINFDTMFGLPGQTIKNFTATIHNVIGLMPRHVSAYSLKLSEGTKLAESFSGIDEDTDREMYHSAAKALGEAGFIHYETSNFAKPGFECRHNLKYWTGAQYLGLGVASHSYVFNKAKERLGNTENLSDYLRLVKEGKKPIVQKHILSDSDEMIEYIMLKLRLMQGIIFNDYDSHFESDFKKIFKEPIDIAENAGLVTKDKDGIYPTLRGFDLQNTLITEFIKII